MARLAQRNDKGTMFAEVPVALWLLIFMFVVPFLDLCTVGVRATFLYSAARAAVVRASKAKDFATDLPGQPSAITLANTTVSQQAAGWSGVSVSSVKTNILITDAITLSQTRTSSPLSQPADSSAYTYQLEVAVTGSVTPLISYSAGVFPPIPGLSAPMALTFVDRQYIENSQGLDK